MIAFENGLIILWDVTEDRAVHIKGSKDLQLKGGTSVSFSDNQSHTYLSDSLDDDEAEKEISSLCWASPDGSILAVGYVDGDILLWDLSVSDSGKGQRHQKSPNDVIKIQLSSANRRLPVIVLHWSSNKAQSGRGGQLFAYGGEEIGSEEVLTVCSEPLNVTYIFTFVEVYALILFPIIAIKEHNFAHNLGSLSIDMF